MWLPSWRSLSCFPLKALTVMQVTSKVTRRPRGETHKGELGSRIQGPVRTKALSLEEDTWAPVEAWKDYPGWHFNLIRKTDTETEGPRKTVPHSWLIEPNNFKAATFSSSRYTITQKPFLSPPTHFPSLLPHPPK